MTELDIIGTKGRQMYPGHRSPPLMPQTADRNQSCLLQSNVDAVRQHVLDQSAVLFRGFVVSEFADCFIGAMAVGCLECRYASTRRTKISNRIFTATKYRFAQEVSLYKDNAYQRKSPLLIAFCYLEPTTEGIVTPLAKMRAVTEAIGTPILGEFDSRSVQHVRHNRPHIDFPWQKVLRTEYQCCVEEFCTENDIAIGWLSGGVFRPQVSQRVAYHPANSGGLFFTEAHLFQISILGNSAARSMISVFANERLPREAFFGDGGSISAKDLTAVRAGHTRASLKFCSRSRDVLLLNNEQFACACRSLYGPGALLASLLNPRRSQEALACLVS